MRHSYSKVLAALTFATSIAVSAAWAQDEAEEPFDCETDVGHLWEDATREELRDAKLHLRSTKLYFNQGLFRKAAREAELAVHLDNTEPEYYMRLAMAYGQLGCYEAAGDAFRAALPLAKADEKKFKKLIPDIANNQQFYWTERFMAGSEHFEEQNYDLAAAEFRNAIAIDSTDVRAWRNLGSAYRGLEKTVEGLEAFRAAYALEPDNERTLDLLRQQIDIRATELYNEGTTTAASQEAAQRDAGIAMLDESIALFDEAISLDPPDAELYAYSRNVSLVTRAKAEVLQAFDPPKAADDFRRAIQLHRSAENARERLVAAGEFSPEDATERRREHLLFVIACFFSVEEHDSTLVYARQVIDLAPKNPEGYRYVAQVLRLKSETEEALKYLLMWQCIAEGQVVDDINAHFASMLTSYDPTDDIIMASITNEESPEEILVYTEGQNTYEAWCWWSQGKAQCFYGGRDLGLVEFQPVVP